MDMTIGILSLILLWVLIVLLFRWNGIELMGSWLGMVGMEGMTAKEAEEEDTEKEDKNKKNKNKKKEIQTPDKKFKVVSTI